MKLQYESKADIIECNNSQATNAFTLTFTEKLSATNAAHYNTAHTAKKTLNIYLK